MAGFYKKYLTLLQSWPLDKSKVGKDLGQHIRDQVKLAFSKGDLNNVDEKRCDSYYNSLERIASNRYGKLYKRSFNSTASGLTQEQCNAVLSPEFLELWQEEERGFLSRTARLFRRKKHVSTDD
ncbi:ubiquinol-cytochrome-c reductase complex assembly factor 2 [Neodiprion pinetum]|uniref:Mitochondrial nucleoid factor 1 n=1 Tax=Neodiprion lecontei TaxID=441921 RepID=A0A6J0BD89_NEOLC|nr:ubiquinol-cytochrome-c reductase complex assembly factor 2 [Neodiprion lecontei]XP_046490183.1 ubiquinol-cytochrome-c reductase complex assembly factor 2 [Neodiprion pinetum]